MLGAERHSGVGNGAQQRRRFAFKLGALALAIVTQCHEDPTTTRLDPLEGGKHFGLFAQDGGDLVRDALGFLKRRARNHLDIHATEIVIGFRLEGDGQLAECEDGCNQCAAATNQCCFPAMDERPFEHRHIAIHDRAFAMFAHTFGAQEISGDQGRYQSRHGQAHDHRNNGRQAELDEELSGDARHQCHRQEHGDNRHGRGQHGKADLFRRIDRCLVRGFAHPHMPDDILDLHDRVIDKDTGHQT